MSTTPRGTISRRGMLTGLAAAAGATALACAPSPESTSEVGVPPGPALRRVYRMQQLPLDVSTGHSQAAAGVLAYLAAIRGQRTLIGLQENNSSAGQNPTFCGTENMVVERTRGLRPAIRGFDLRMAPGTEQTMDCIPVAKAAYEKYGQIPTFSYHQGVPSDQYGASSSVDRFANCQRKGFDIRNLQRPGSPGYDTFWSKMDVLADRLAPLAAADIPVLFRPFHETISSNFWWGSYFDRAQKRWINSGEDYIQLWRSVHKRMVQDHGLTNLLWVWCVESKFRMYYMTSTAYNRPPHFSYKQWYPGDEYVDVAAADLYSAGWTNSAYSNPTTTSTSTIRYDLYGSDARDLEAVAGSKPLGIAECDWPAAGSALRNHSVGLAYQVFWHEGHWPSATAQGGREGWFSHISSVFADDATVTARDLPTF